MSLRGHTRGWGLTIHDKRKRNVPLCIFHRESAHDQTRGAVSEGKVRFRNSRQDKIFYLDLKFNVFFEQIPWDTSQWQCQRFYVLLPGQGVGFQT
jgi:hypothetical protein